MTAQGSVGQVVDAAVTLGHIREAHARIAARIHRTPVFTSMSLDEIGGAQLFFKCENLQKTGSFKIRGATNAVFSLSDEEAKQGVAAPSSGNHGAEVVRRTGAHLVHPYNDARVIAGQGTAAVELLEEIPDLDMVITPASGGGLLSGTSIAAKGMRPEIRVIGGEPLNADDAYRPLKSGKIEAAATEETMA